MRVVRRGHGLDDLPPADAGRGRTVPGGPRLLRDLPRAGGRSARRRRAAPVRRAGVSRVPALRVPRRRLRTLPLPRLWSRSAGPVFVQGSSMLSELRRASHGRTRRAPGRPRLSAGAGAAVGADAAASAAVPARVGPRPVPCGRRGLRPDDPRLPPARGRRGRGGRRTRRGRGPSTWLRTIPSSVEGWPSCSVSAVR